MSVEKPEKIPNLEIIRAREPYHFERIDLTNGGELYLQKASIPFVHLGILFKFGAREDPPEKEGLVHMLEHLLSTKTKDFPSFRAMKKYEEEHGFGVNYGETSLDSIRFSGTSLFQDLPHLLYILSQVISLSQFGAKQLSHEKGVIIQEVRRKNLPQLRKVWNQVGKETFGDHPLARIDTLGEEETIMDLTLEDLKEFARQYLVPHNAVFILIGNLKVKEVKKNLEEAFPRKSGKKAPEYQPIVPPDPKKLHSEYSRADLGIKGETQSFLRWDLSFSVREWFSLCHLTFSLLERNLNEELRFKRGWVYALENDWVRLKDLGGSWFTVFMPPKYEKSAEEIFWKVAAKTAKDVSSFNICQRNHLKSLLSLDTNYAKILDYALGSLVTDGRIITLEENYQKTASLTFQEFQDFLKKYVSPNRTHLTIIRP
jgi:predicted Zn-dependent peptidase